MNICQIAILLSISLFLVIHILLSVYPYDSSTDNIDHITTHYNTSLQTLRLKFQSHITHGTNFNPQIEENNQNIDSKLTNDLNYNNRSVTSSSQSIKKATLTSSTNSNYHNTKRVLIFTMDSIESYEKNSKAGGAAGTLFKRYIHIIYAFY